MAGQDFSTTISTDRTPQEAFAAVVDPRGWWSEHIDGATAEVGDQFTYYYMNDHRCTVELTEVVPGRRVVWRVLDNFFSFTADRTEWTGTDIVFDISETPEGSRLRFTHVGLVPEYECFDLCTKSWGFYVAVSLRELITTGKGRPNIRTADADLNQAPVKSVLGTRGAARS
ncbi:ATPase [Saccharothrix sp. NRRL B-16348]|uniref:SRPBCC family protein n=1 Tax=Saccharothrix sp. NRRL B-16348 TaxID=1415542 RepID=UPI0006AE4FBA|nr:SRPBCC domain-containing protein [Saccharothrix sp. NRRL B-16348]KOX18808.1 ATPase [Saccharothrix sp. NRRL B-16348]